MAKTKYKIKNYQAYLDTFTFFLKDNKIKLTLEQAQDLLERLDKIQ